MCVNGCASRSDDKRLLGFPVKEYKKGRGEKSTQARMRWRGERKRAERDIPDQSGGTRVEKNRAASREREERGVEGERRRSEKGSAGDGSKLLVSQADIGSIRPPGCHLHRTQYPPLFAISPLSISLHLPPRCIDSECDALFFHSPSHRCQRFCVYHSLSFSLSLAGKKRRKKKKLYLTYTCIIFLLPIPHRLSLFFSFFAHFVSRCFPRMLAYSPCAFLPPGSPYITIFRISAYPSFTPADLS